MAVDFLELFHELKPEFQNVTVVEEEKPLVETIVAVTSAGLVKVSDV